MGPCLGAIDMLKAETADAAVSVVQGPDRHRFTDCCAAQPRFTALALREVLMLDAAVLLPTIRGNEFLHAPWTRSRLTELCNPVGAEQAGM